MADSTDRAALANDLFGKSGQNLTPLFNETAESTAELMKAAEDLMIPRMILSRIRSRKYDHVLSLGMNCEPAFRFSLSWGGVESSPFSWSLCSDLRSLAEVLRHPELTGSEGFSFVDTALMWRCNRTGISFHGKQMLPIDASTIPPELLAADKTDLAQRLAYLNEKFTRILSDESSKAWPQSFQSGPISSSRRSKRAARATIRWWW